MPQIYEGMFLLDNDVVREGWNDAKAVVTGTLEKYGGKVLTARRWDERRLAYPIAGKKRGTYLLAYYEMPSKGIAGMRRDFDLSERVLRYLELAADSVPEAEADLATSEQSSDFIVPEPPADDAPEELEGQSAEEAPKAGSGETKEASAKAPAPATPAAEAPTTEAPTTEAPATEAPAAEAPATEAPAPEAPAAEAPADETEGKA